MQGKLLRPSVIKSGEWFKDKDPEIWKRTRLEALKRDNYTCVYCLWQARKFMQVNHIGAEDNHSLDNLETVCAACHATLHIGINSMEEFVCAFDCKPGLNNVARVVRATRTLVSRNTPWEEIERQVLEHFLLPEGRVYSFAETTMMANKLLKQIQPGEYRAYLPEGKSILFHEAPEWNGFSDRVHRWQL